MGSTLKPIIYWELLRLGLSFEERVSTAPITISLRSGPWSPESPFSSQQLEEEVSVKVALQRSYNRPFIRSAQNVGFERLESVLVKRISSLKTPLAQYPAQLLGAVELSLKELLDLYLPLFLGACGGDEDANKIVEALSDHRKTTIRKLISPAISSLRFFAKTGTSNLGRDNWFVFYLGRSLGAIWIGNEGENLERDLGLYGGTTAFKVFQQFVLGRGKRPNNFLCPIMP